MLVTTTGIHGNDLKLIQADLHRYGAQYGSDLSSSTNVLVAKRFDSPKYKTARERGIPCVTPAWILLGRCSRNRLGDFEAGRSLLGMEVCVTSLSNAERSCVQEMCQTRRAFFNVVLTRNCGLLIIPSIIPISPSNEKLQFATRNHINIISYERFMEQYTASPKVHRRPMSFSSSKSLSSSSSLLASATGFSGLVVYCSPPEGLTESVRRLLHEVGVRLVASPTSLTTHVVLLGPTEELFAPRPGVEFVSLAWLVECAARRRRVECAPYRIEVRQRPVITFTAVPAAERDALRVALEGHTDLPCHVEDGFILGAVAATGSEWHNTTHLVLGDSEAAATSPKVAALCWRALKQGRPECFLVEVSWVRDSLSAGRWLDSARYTILLPTLKLLGNVPFPQHTGTGTLCNQKKDKTEEVETGMGVEFEKEEEAEEAGVEMSLGFYEEEIVNEEEKEKVEDNLKTNIMERASGVVDMEGAAVSQGCATPEVAQSSTAESTPSRSLESLIAALESKAASSSLSSSSVVPAPAHFSNIVASPRIIEVAAAFLRSPPPEEMMQSQFVVYCHDHAEKIRSRTRVDVCVSAVQTSASHDNDASLSNNPGNSHDINDSDRATNTLSNRRACLMVAKALAYTDESFARLQELGCTLATTVEECTHYVTAKPSRTEVFLCTAAAGKWILAPSFLEATLREGHIVLEESHEWSPERARAAEMRQSVVDLVRACALQRRETTKRPFGAWRIALCCTSDARAESFMRVLRSGGCNKIVIQSPAQLLADLPRDTTTLGGMTHILSDDEVWSESQLEALSAINCATPPVLRLEYIAHCLCVEESEPLRYNVLRLLTSRKRPRGE